MTAHNFLDHPDVTWLSVSVLHCPRAQQGFAQCSLKVAAVSSRLAFSPLCCGARLGCLLIPMPVDVSINMISWLSLSTCNQVVCRSVASLPPEYNPAGTPDHSDLTFI